MQKVAMIILILFLTQVSHSVSEKKIKKIPEQTNEIVRFPANTPTYPKYVEECRTPAIAKLKAIAQLNSFEIDVNTVSIHSIDDRWYNPSKYVWFQSVVKKADGSTEIIQTLTQKSFAPLQACF